MLIFESLFMFFKQNVAYDMRISYLSSDVCSSDLAVVGAWSDKDVAAPGAENATDTTCEICNPLDDDGSHPKKEMSYERPSRAEFPALARRPRTRHLARRPAVSLCALV